MDVKLCSECNRIKSLTEFGRLAKSKDGLSSKCKSCHNFEKRQYRFKNIIRCRELDNARYDYKRDWELKKKYGITLEQYKTLLADQDYKCAICSDSVAYRNVGTNLDHCHNTGTIRGVLCNSCNTALGHLKDNPEIVLKAFNYLRKYK